MSKTDLHSSLLFLMIKLEEAKNNSMSDKNFVAALTDVLKYFRDNGELKKAYEIQKDSLTNMANSPWAKLVIGMLTSKVQEDKVDVELPDIDALIKENTSDEFIKKKINNILEDNVELKKNNMIFYRFGDIPEDECSSIWNNNDEVIGKEKGVSVYEAHKNINGTYSPVLPFPTNEMAFNDFIKHIEYFTGNKYLVTGDLLDETGTDGEPLIKNVKILMKLQDMKEETRKVVVLDWEDKIKLQQIIKDLEQIANSYDNGCKDAVTIKNTLYYLQVIEEKIN